MSFSSAAKIPDRIRSERLLVESDPIKNAQANQFDRHMQVLTKIWYAYVEPEKEYTNCPICLNNILQSFRALKPKLIELERDYQTLKSLNENT